MLSRFSRVRLFAILRTVARPAPLSMGFSRQEYWSGLPCPPPGHLPDPGMEPTSPVSPALVGQLFTTSGTWRNSSFKAEQYSIVYMYRTFCIHSSVDGYSSCFHVFAILL